MAALSSPPPGFPRSRDALQRVATHVLARRRREVAGRIGLRATPGGFGTPAFGDGPEVVRVDGDLLVHETADRVQFARLTTLAEAADLVGVNLDAPLSVGHDTTELGDPGAALEIDPASAQIVGSWFGLVATALDDVAGALPLAARPSIAQLWPEHFDLAIDVAWGDGDSERVNLGGSAGDASDPWPYAYVGPWGPERPGDAEFWNASFGAVLPYRSIAATSDLAAARVLLAGFFRRGLDLLSQP